MTDTASSLRSALALRPYQQEALDAIDEGLERGTWSVVREPRDRSRERLATGLDLGYAQGRAEDEARRLNAAHLVDPHAVWRQRPASDKQLSLLARMGRIPQRGMTAGDASDAITAAMASRRRSA